jgi:simple sugar transport system ATP-binding protein
MERGMREAIAVEKITKSFPGVVANKDVSFSVERGEIRAIVGENGAGKTTLMKILYGLEEADAGTIRVNGEPVRIPNARAAIDLGIGMVHQHFKLVPSFALAQNILLGVEPRRGLFVDREQALEEVQELSARYGLAVHGDKEAQDASVGEQQRAEILKALYRGADILILDEPTAVLTDMETEELFVMLRRLAADGKTILFISHKLREVLAISDYTTVMRKGRVVGTVKTSETTDCELAEMMVGRETVGGRMREEAVQSGEPVLELRRLRVRDVWGNLSVRGVDLVLHSGEVLGIAGVDGNGQVELAEAITGLRPVAGGKILLQGREVQNRSPRAIRETGLAHIPSDRNAMGVAVDAQVWENINAVEYYRQPYSGSMMLSINQMLNNAAQRIARFGVQTPGFRCPTCNLSGGNVQRLIVARELGTDEARVVVAAQPTRGIDIAGTEAIREMLLEYANRGAGVLLVSADLDEVLALSDRVKVMYEGELQDAGTVDDEVRQRVGQLMTGGECTW